MTILAQVCFAFDTIGHLIDDIWGACSANQISGFVIDLQWVYATLYEPIHLVHLLNCTSLSIVS